MHRSVLGIAVATTVALVFMVAPTAASATERGCPPSQSGFVLYEFFGQVGDPAPAPGAEPLWDDTIVEPFTEVFGSLEAGLEAFGFESADELYAILLAEWLAIDKNGDSSLCQLDLPDTPGNPAWVFNAIDDNAKTPS